MEQANNKEDLKKQLDILDRVKNKLYGSIDEYSKEQQQIIKKLDDIEELKKANYKDYLKNFDEEFETHNKIRTQETPLLMQLFNEFVQHDYKPSNMYWVAAKTKNKIKEDLIKTLNDEQKDLLEQLQFCEDRILDDMTEQAYIYGYAISVQLREEAISQYPSKKEEN